jgi:hypothetical protein
MIRTIILILLAVVVSSVTTVALMIRYTKPIASVKQEYRPAVVLAETPVNPEPAAQANPSPVHVAAPVEVRQVVQPVAESQTQAKVAQPPAAVQVEQSKLAAAPAVPAEIKTDTPAAAQRTFDSERLNKDVAALSSKVQSLNDILSSEIQRLRGKPAPTAAGGKQP